MQKHSNDPALFWIRLIALSVVLYILFKIAMIPYV